MKKAFLITASVMVFLLALITLSVTGPRLLGIKTYTNSDGSIIYVKNIDCSSIMPEDVILYEVNANGGFSTNTVLDVNIEKQYFLISSSELSLPGANDGSYIISTVPIDFSAYLGKCVLSLPYIGHLSEIISTKAGFITLTGLTLVCLLVILLISVLPSSSEKKSADKKKKKTNKEKTSAEAEVGKTDDKKSESEAGKQDDKKPESKAEKQDDKKPEPKAEKQDDKKSVGNDPDKQKSNKKKSKKKKK